MPKEITHWLIAQEAFLSLEDNNQLKIAVSQALNLFFCAAVIPDTPYYFLGKDGYGMKRSATSFHNPPRNSFSPFLRILERPPVVPFCQEQSFIAGICSHIIVDSIFHPTISLLSNAIPSKSKNTDPIAIHRQLETALDLFYLEAGDQLKSGVLLKDYLASIEIDLAKLYELLKVLFDLPDKTPQTLLQKAIKHHCLCQALFHNPILPRLLQGINIVIPHRLDQLLGLFYGIPQDAATTWLTGAKNPVLEKPPHSPEILKMLAIKKISALFYIMGECHNREELHDSLRNITGPHLLKGQIN